MTGRFTERRDEFRSPFPSWRHQLFLPAVEIHATQMLNLVRGDSLRRLSPFSETVLLLLSAAVFGWGLMQLRPAPAAAVACAGEWLVGGVAVWAFTRAGVWFPWLVVGAVQIPAALGASILYHSLDWYRERRRFQASRREAEAKIKEQATLIDKARDAILVRDLSDRILYANPSATRLYGWSPQEFTGDGVVGQLFAPCAPQAAEARQATLDHGEWQGELEQATRDGRKLLVESRWTLIKDEYDQPKSILLINTDITEKKEIEKQFLRSQRLEGIWSLAGGMAHDLNNALAPVLMGLQRLRQKNTDADIDRMLSVMEANTHRGADIVRQVLTFSRGHENEKKILAPAALLHEMERIASQTFPKSISTAVLAPSDVWPVLGNETKLHQVLLNLVVNARDAMPKGGQLTLAADNIELSAEEAAHIPNASPGQFVLLLVADTGTGIAPQALPHLFEPFFTTKPPGQGTGLGLSTTAYLVRQHGGFINVMSDEGKGTTFEIYLPRAAGPTTAPETNARAHLPRGRQELILVIDDDQSVREMMASTLEEYGYRVVSATQGAEGLALLKKESSTVSVVLLDVDMPVMNGPAALAVMRNQYPNLPVVMMGRKPESITSTPSVQANAYLPKPFRVDDLLCVLRAQLNAPSKTEP